MNFQRLINVLRKTLIPYKLSVYQVLRERAIAESADYAEQHLNDAMIFNKPSDLWSYSARNTDIDSGLVLEFGVFEGKSINHFAKVLPDATIHGFDSFEGLAEDWRGYHLPKGTFDQGGKLPKVEQNVTLHKGWFDQTLPDFLKENDGPIRLCHVDCDTYESSAYLLDKIAHRLSPGSVVVFDEYYGYPNWKSGEFRAWQETCANHKLEYRYIALANMQVAVKIL